MARFVLDQVISTRSATFRERHRRCAFRRRVPILYSKRKYFPPPKQMLLKIRVYARQWNSYYIPNNKYQKFSNSNFLLKAASQLKTLTWDILFPPEQTARHPGGRSKCRLQNSLTNISIQNLILETDIALPRKLLDASNIFN